MQKKGGEFLLRLLIYKVHSSYQPLQQRIVARLEKKLKIVTNINAPIVEIIAISIFNSD